MVQNSSGISYSGPVNIQSNSNNPWGVAVDSLGNVFYTTAASSSGQSLYKLTPAGGQYSQTQLDSTLGDPVNIALDMQGNIYIAQDLGATSSIVKETFSSNTTYTKSTVASNISNAVGVWVDASGNLFYTSQSSGALYEIPYGTPPSLTFANTNEGATTTTTTSGTNPITLQNVGTAPFTLEVPATGTNPSVSANFSATGTTNCNLLSTNSSIESLAAGSTCNLTVTFAPTTGGSISGSLVLLDNNLNAGSPNYATQTIPLSGTGVWLTPTVTSVTPSYGPITGGTTVTIGGTYLAGATGVSFGGTAGTIVTDTSTSMTVTSPVVSSVGAVDVTVTTPGGTSATSSADKFLYQAMPTVTLAMSYNGNTVGTGGSVASGNALKLTATVKVGTNAVYPGIVAFCNAAASRCTDVDLLGTVPLTSAGTASISFVPGIGSYSYKAVFLPTGDVFTASSSTSTLTVTAASTQPTTTTISPATGSAGSYTLSATVTSTGIYPAAGPTGTVNFLDTTNSNTNVGPGGVGATLGTATATYGFASATSIATGTTPQRHVLFDYNNDGKLDLAVANTGGNTVTVYTGNGNGTFNSTAVATISTTDPTSITAGDFNGDGYPDLAVASYGGYTVAIYTGNGSGTFTLKQTITLPSSSQPLWISIGDFNNDGVLDFVTTSQTTNAAHVYLGNGDGTFTLKTTLTFSSFPTTSALGDFNGDGKLDMAIPVISSGTVAIYLGNGDGTFTLKQSPSVGTNPHGAVAADFNRDGLVDLAVANNGSASVTVLQGAGDGTFTTSATLTVPASPDLLSVGDFNGDGIPDIVVGNTTTTVLTGIAQGSFTSASLATAIGQVLTGDLNGDGLSDIVGLSGSTAVSLLAQRTWTATATVTGVAVTGTGNHSINASYAGDANYAASTSSGTDTLVAGAVTTVTTLGVLPSAPVSYGTAVTLTASVSPNSSQGHAVTGDTVTFQNGATTLCSNVAVNSSGQASCTTSALPASTTNSLTAVFAGDTNFATSTSTALPYTVNQATQAITFAPATPVTYGVSPITLTATGGASGNAVTFSVVSGPGTISGSTLTVTGAGSIVVAANQAGNTNYTAAPQVTATIVVNQATQAITFAPSTPVTYGVSPITLTATGGASGNAVTFSVVSGPGTISGSTLTVTGAGSIVVAANQAGNTNYTAAPQVTATIVVNQATQAITFAPSTPVTYGVSPITLTATGGASGNAVTFSVVSGPGTISGSTLTVTGAGSIVVAANQAGNTNYTAAPQVTATIVVNQATQAITFAPSSPVTYGVSPITLTATGGASGNAVTFSVVSGPGTISGSTLTVTGGGSIVVAANQAGNANYAAAPQVTATIMVNQATTATTLTLSPATTVSSGSAVTLTAAVTASGNALTKGTVNFCNATASYCTDQDLVGTAQLTTAGTASIRLVPGAGSHSYKAVFEGSASGTSSSSGTSMLAVTSPLATTTTTITPSGSAGNYTLTATVTGTGIATAGPSGTVSFLDTTNSNAVVGTAALVSETLSVGFTNPQTLTLSGPTFGVTGDFNGDGIPDMAFSSDGSNNVIIAQGNGDGTFNVLSTMPTATQAYGIAAGDFNGDGKLDLAVTNYGNAAVTILLGNGDGSFMAGTSVAVGNYPWGVAVGDFNGDGNLDVVTTNIGDNNVTILLGKGDGTFTAATVSPAVGSFPTSASVGDFNGDGKLDIAVANFHATTVSVLMGNGDGTFTAAANVNVGSGPITVVAGDINGDGKLDLAVDNYSGNNITTYLGNGDGTFGAATATLNLSGNGAGMVLADLNGDGKLDLATEYSATNFQTFQSTYMAASYTGDGNGGFTLASTQTTGANPQWLLTGDWNGDGYADLAVEDGSTASILLTQISGSATATAMGVSPAGTGTHNVEASYAGDSNYAASVSGTVGLTAQLVPTNVALVANPSASTYGQQVTLTATLGTYTAQGHSTDGEAISFYNGSTLLGTANLSSGSASFPVSTLPAGSDSISASYSTDGNFASSTAAISNYSVAQANKTITFPALTTPVSVNSTATLAASTSNGDPVTYSITQGSATISGTTITFTTAGTVTIAADSAATANYAAAATVSQTITVNVAPGSSTAAATPVGSTSATQTATVNVLQGGTLGLIAVVTQGATGLDYNAVTGGTCTAGNSYTLGQACTVQYTFSPQHPWQRDGGIQLVSTSGAVMGSTYLTGTGTGPQLAFGPATAALSTLANGVFGGLAVGANGDIFLSDAVNGSVVEVPFNAGVYGPTVTLATGFSSPQGIAIDGVGTLYVADSGHGAIQKIASINGAYGAVSSVVSGLSNPRGVAVDGNANLFFTDTGNNAIKELPRSLSGSPSVVTLVSSGLSGPTGIAIDSNSDLFFADTGNNQIDQLPYTNGSFGSVSTITGGGLSGPQGVAVDAGGNVFFVDTGNNQIDEVPRSGSTYGSTVILPSLVFSGPQGIAADSAGNLYIVDATPRVAKLDISDPPSLTFPSTNDGSTSATQSVTITDNGNATLVVAAETASSPFTRLSTGGPFTDCLLTASLATGARCSLSLAFDPTSPQNGTVTGTAVLTDNHLNVPGATQTLNLSGTAVGLPAVTGISPSLGPAAGGTQVTLTGSRFTGATAVSFGTNPATNVTVVSDTSITATSPAGSGTVDVAVTTGVGTSLTTSADHFLYQIPQAVTFAPASPVTFGVSPIALAATGGASGNPVTFTLVSGPATLNGNILTVTGAGTIVINADQAGNQNYTAAPTVTASIVVNQATPALSWATPAGITYGTALSATQLDASSPVPGTFVYNPAAGAVPAAGTDTLSVTFTPTDTANYTSATASVQLTVGKATPALILTSSANPAFVQNPITLTAVASAAAGVPTGMVTFLDGTTALGTVSLSGGTATFITSALSVGPHTLTASYAGDAAFGPQVSAALTEQVQDFAFNLAANSDATQQIVYGGTASYTFGINPANAQTLAAPITFTVTGLPPGATATFSPKTLSAGSASSDVVMTVILPLHLGELREMKSYPGLPPVALSLLLLPLAAMRRRARKLKGLFFMVLLLAGGGAATLFSGCAAGGYVQARPYTLTVTATSGTLSRSTTVTLKVE